MPTHDEIPSELFWHFWVGSNLIGIKTKMICIKKYRETMFIGIIKSVI